MARCGGIDDGMRYTLCRSLEGLLHRDRSFAQSFVGDRRTLQRIVKLIVQETDAKQFRRCSRLERSAGLHCIVLAFRLARIDEFAAEVSLPILIAGSLSGVVHFPPVCRHDEGRERQQNPPGAQPSSVYSNEENNFGEPKEIGNNGSFWPSTPLSSAQELAAHAIVNPLLEAIEDGAQSLLEALEAVSCPTIPIGEEEQEEHTVKSVTSTMTASSTCADADASLPDDDRTSNSVVDGRRRRQNKAPSPASGGHDDFDDPATCGTFALRRLCVCGLGFALLPPASGSALATAERRRHHKPTGGTAGSPNLGIVPAIVETLVVLAHGEFLHPDAAVLADFLNHGPDASRQNKSPSRDQHQHGQGEPPLQPRATQTNGSGPIAGTMSPPRPTTMHAATSVDTQYMLFSSVGGTAKSCSNGGGGGGGGAEGYAGPGGPGGGGGNIVPAPRRGIKGACMICAGKGPTTGNPSSPVAAILRGVASLRSVARLLLAQIGVSDLHKAQARAFSHAKRRARIVAVVEQNKLPPAVKRSIGLNSRVKGGGKTGSQGGGDESGGVGTVRNGSGGGGGGGGVGDAKFVGVLEVSPGATTGEPKQAEVEPGNNNHKQNIPPSSVSSCSNLSRANACLACCREVLGHPLDAISNRCGGCAGGRNNHGEQHLAPEAAEVARTAATGALQRAPVAGADERYVAKHASFGDPLKSAVEPTSNGAESVGGRRGKRGDGVGAMAVSQALGDKAVEMVVEQLGIAIKGRRFERDASVKRLAEAHARGKKAKEVKLDRKVDFRRRLAAAASEARQEIETVALRRQLLRGGPPSSRKSRSGGDSGGDTAAPPVAARVKKTAGLGDEMKWDENGDLIEPDSETVAAAAAASAAAVTAKSLARWNRQQEQEQKQRLRQLLVEMREAVEGDGGCDAGRRRPTPRRGGSSGVDSLWSGSRASISGSGIYRDLAQGADATHSAILSSMRDDGVNRRAYLDERRMAFRDVVANEEEQRNAFLALPGDSESGNSGRGSSTADGTTDWESTLENATGVLLGEAAVENSRHSTANNGRVGSANTSTTGTGGGRDDNSAGTADEAAAAAGSEVRVIARDAEQLRLARARKAAREERIEKENREAIEAERGARRRAQERAEAARNERKAKALAQKEMQRRREALDRQEEETRTERAKRQEEHLIATSAEKKRQAKLRRARERENRKKAALENARHEEEMVRINRWREQERERRLEKEQKKEKAQRAAEAKRASELQAVSREEERRRAEAEAKRLSSKQEREVAAARLKRGEFRYIRGRLVFRDAKGALLMAANNCG